MDWDLSLLLMSVGAMVFVGIPVIRVTVFLPASFDFKEIAPEELSDKQRQFLARADEALERLGYRAAKTFSVSNLPGANLSRFYASAVDPAWILVSAVAGRDAKGATAYTEILTRFADGTVLGTKNTQLSDVFAPLPHYVPQVYPGVQDVAVLKARHDAKSRELILRGPEHRDPKTFFQVYNEAHGRFCAHQTARGLLRLDAAKNVYRATAWTALYGIRNFLNPLADNFTWPRLAAGLLLGAAPPAACALYAPQGSALAFTFSGAAVGCLFQQKSHIWAFLLGYLPMRLLDQRSGAGLLLCVWMAAVAHWASAWRDKRERVV